jgi:hypothetical protein
MQQEVPTVRVAADMRRFEGRAVIAIGAYRAVAMPVKGAVSGGPKLHAVVQLEDGTDVYIEPLDSRESRRKATELRRFEGRRVRVHGVAHSVMPSQGQGLIAPCLSHVTSVNESDEP